MSSRWWAAVCLCALIAGSSDGADPTQPPTSAVRNPLRLSHPLLLTQLPLYAEREAAADGMLRADYGHGGRIVLVEADGAARLLTTGFQSACSPEVYFDATRILFSGKRSAADPWNVFELELSGPGAEARQITRDLGNCRSPIYQSTLYTLDSPEPWYQVTFVSDAARTRNEDGSGPATHLYSCKLDGSAVRRLSYNISSDFDPCLMEDGRMVFASWQRSNLDCGGRGRIRLFGINLDGTDYALFADPAGRAVQSMPCVTADRLVLFVEADRVGWDGAGQLTCVSYRRPLNSYRQLTDPQAGLFHRPSPLPDGTVLVSRRPVDGSGSHAVGCFDPRDGSWRPVFDDPRWHDVESCLLRPRALADGRSSVVSEQDPHGKLYCLDIYQTDVQPEWLPEGSVRRLRVLEGIPVSEGGPAPQPPRVPAAEPTVQTPPLVARRILGEFDLAADGSFHLEIPANTPIELQTLDAEGMALRSCSWIWAKNHESRGCIGCHEDGELSPENRFVDALSRPAVALTLPPARRRTVDFRRDLMPIIDSKCVVCHAAGGAAPRLDGGWQPLTLQGTAPINRAYASLLAPAEGESSAAFAGRYVDPGRARTSPLIWHLLGRNTSRPWDAAGAQRPHLPIPREPVVEPLTDPERRTFIEWVDMGALWETTPSVPAQEPSP